MSLLGLCGFRYLRQFQRLSLKSTCAVAAQSVPGNSYTYSVIDDHFLQVEVPRYSGLVSIKVSFF